MGIGLGLLVAFVAGLVSGVVIVRYGMGLGERVAWASREGVPALSEYDNPLEQASTSGATDLELEI